MRGLKKSILALPLMLVVFSSSCLSYLARQGVDQANFLLGAQPIKEVLRSKPLLPAEREKLKFIVSVRKFAEGELGLKNNRNYQNVNLDFNKKVFNVSACKPLSFTPYLWWFFIVGSVPYKGFFDEKSAKKEEESLKASGYETMSYAVSGYSTLGYFSDPVWPQMLQMDDMSLAELIIHELTHAVIYIPGQVSFNETLANFVGEEGAKRFFKEKFGSESEEFLKLKKNQTADKKFKEYFHELFLKLELLYESDLNDSEKLKQKQKILDEARSSFAKSDLGKIYKNFDWDRVNNAYLMSFKRYDDNPEVFEELLEAKNFDLKSFLQEISLYARGPDPLKAIKIRVAVIKCKNTRVRSYF